MPHVSARGEIMLIPSTSISPRRELGLGQSRTLQSAKLQPLSQRRGQKSISRSRHPWSYLTNTQCLPRARCCIPAPGTFLSLGALHSGFPTETKAGPSLTVGLGRFHQYKQYLASPSPTTPLPQRPHTHPDHTHTYTHTPLH